MRKGKTVPVGIRNEVATALQRHSQEDTPVTIQFQGKEICRLIESLEASPEDTPATLQIREQLVRERLQYIT